jgi:hypothetical protein
MMVSLRFALWLALTMAIGLSALEIIFRGKKTLSSWEAIAVSYPLGLGLVSLEMALLAVLRMKYNILAIAAPWLPIMLVAARIATGQRAAKKTGQPSPKVAPLSSSARASSLLEKFLISAISFEVLHAFFLALIMPVEAYDAVAIYAIKSKIFYFAKTIPPNFFSDFKAFVPHIEYPLLVPLAQTYLYIFLGGLNDHIVKAVFPLYYLSMLIVFYRVAGRALNRRHALLFTFLLATVPQFRNHAATAYTDLPFAFYCSASIFYIFLYTKESGGRFLALSLILSLLGVWTKTEGLMFAVLNLLVLGAYIMSGGKKVAREVLWYIVVSSLAISGYLCLRRLAGITLHSDFGANGLIVSGNSAAIFKRAASILYEYQTQFFGPKKWNIVWIIALFFLVVGRKRILAGDLRYITLSLFLIFAGYSAIYMMLPDGDIGWHLSTTASRFFMHPLPVTVLWLALAFKEMGLDI